MRIVFLTVLITLAAAPVLSQEPPPAGSAQRGDQSYMKYMCYTCHGTIGRGPSRYRTETNAGNAIVPGLRPSGAHAAPRYAGLSHRICQ